MLESPLKDLVTHEAYLINVLSSCSSIAFQASSNVLYHLLSLVGVVCSKFVLSSSGVSLQNSLLAPSQVASLLSSFNSAILFSFSRLQSSRQNDMEMHKLAQKIIISEY